MWNMLCCYVCYDGFNKQCIVVIIFVALQTVHLIKKEKAAGLLCLKELLWILMMCKVWMSREHLQSRAVSLRPSLGPLRLQKVIKQKHMSINWTLSSSLSKKKSCSLSSGLSVPAACRHMCCTSWRGFYGHARAVRDLRAPPPPRCESHSCCISDAWPRAGSCRAAASFRKARCSESPRRFELQGIPPEKERLKETYRLMLISHNITGLWGLDALHWSWCGLQVSSVCVQCLDSSISVCSVFNVVLLLVHKFNDLYVCKTSNKVHKAAVKQVWRRCALSGDFQRNDTTATVIHSFNVPFHTDFHSGGSLLTFGQLKFFTN